ncbi:hypothetical protein KR054_005566 [Drosophila jambulina]|nr:hypothetical protein KR054_005566 [Drosophila jambulina]
MDIYINPGTPGTRAIFMTAKALGLELNSKIVNPMAGDNLKPEFVKLNPQHTVPTLVDNGFVIWESRAIVVYLAEKYGKPDTPLYPRDPKKRAVIHQRLFFDLDTLYNAISAYFFPIYRTGQVGDQAALDKIKAAFGFLDSFLEGQEYFAGSQLSVADIVLLSSVSLVEMVKFDLKEFPNLDKWYKNAQKVTPGWDENLASIKKLQKFTEDLRAGKK